MNTSLQRTLDTPRGFRATGRDDSGDRGPPSDWPNRSASQGLEAAGRHWHVQHTGEGPPLLLLHGTGASTHSWAGLLPLLATGHEVLAPDLPGHGFTAPMVDPKPTLPAMAAALGDLLDATGFAPETVVGHSAGAALALRLALDGRIRPRVIVGLNAALMPYGGLLAPLAQPLARLFAAAGPVSRLMAAQARRPGTVERLIAGTGSRLDGAGIAAYRRLLGREDHVAATLAMMAHWDLRALVADLGALEVPLCLVVGEGDRTVPPAQANAIAERTPRARVVRLPDLGHLAHEERPRAAFDAILDAERWGGEGRG